MDRRGCTEEAVGAVTPTCGLMAEAGSSLLAQAHLCPVFRESRMSPRSPRTALSERFILKQFSVGKPGFNQHFLVFLKK